MDDDEGVRGLVVRGLRQEGYEVDAAPGASDGLALLRKLTYDLVVLDLVLPGLDGERLLRQILTERPTQSVLVLSCRTDTRTKVRCLETGAEDYLTKPFSLEELVARVRARLRTRGRSEWVSAGRIRLDLVRRQADVGAGPVVLAEREFLLLQELMREVGRMVRREELLARVWGYHFDPGSNVVDVYISRLRAKLGFDLIETVRGEGYRLTA